MSKERLTEKIVVNDTEYRECAHTKATCHHKECKCPECPLTDLFCDEFYKAIDCCYEEAYANGCLAGIELGKSEYRDLEEQGLLLRLPCKTGDVVYTVCSWGIESGVVGSIEIISDRVFVNNIRGAMIGEAQNIFLTQSEAEEKLRELEGK